MNDFHKNNAPLFAGIIIVLFLAIASTLQVMHDHLTSSFGKESFRFTIKHRSVIPPEFIKHLTFGFDNVLADYYWISAVQDFTGWDHEEGFYLNYFKNISAIDPRFEYPYLFAIFTGPTEKDPSSINKVASIADLGIQTLPNNWQIPLYMGTMYNMFAKDEERALHYLKIATEIDNVPPVVPITYASITAKKLLGKDASRELMKTIRDTTDNETIKKLAEEGIAMNEFAIMIEKAVIAYKAKHSYYPKTVDALVKEKFVVIPEKIALQFSVLVNQKTGEVTLRAR